MPTPLWPTTLPQEQLAGLKRHREPNVLRFKTDQGPTKVRRRSTKAVETQTCQMQLTGAQLTTFDTFYGVTLQDGTLAFEWRDAVTDATVNFVFTTEPDWELIVPAPLPNDRVYEATFVLEVS